MVRKIAASLVFFISLVLSLNAHALLFGLKSCGSGGPHCGTGLVRGGGSLAPTSFFSFAEDGSSFNDVGFVNVNGALIDADGLALSSSNSFFAFDLVTKDSSNNAIQSRLISINEADATANYIGSSVLDRDIRGAAFDSMDQLWAIDSLNNQLVQIDTSTGSELFSIDLMLNGLAYDVSTGTDIAFNAQGEMVFVSETSFFTLDEITGDLTSLFDGVSGEFNAGLAFSNDSSVSDDITFTYEVNGYDDIYMYDTSATRSLLYENIISQASGGFNAGRGDLASMSFQKDDPKEVPLPSTILLLLIGLIMPGFIGGYQKT